MKSYRLETSISKAPVEAARALTETLEHLPGWGVTLAGIRIERDAFVLDLDGEAPRAKQLEHMRLKVEA